MKSANVFLTHILESIEKIETSLQGKTKKDFLDSIDLQDANVRRLEIIGEAAKNLPIAFTKKHKNVPWSDIARTRDKLIHHYFGVDLDQVWLIIKDDLPKLKKQIQKINESLDGK